MVDNGFETIRIVSDTTTCSNNAEEDRGRNGCRHDVVRNIDGSAKSLKLPLNVCPQEGDDLVSLDVGHLAEGSHYPEDQNPDRVIAVLHRLGGPYRAHKKL
jgi:hypothetical protein